MSRADVRVHPDADQLAAGVARDLLAVLVEVQSQSRVPQVGLTGGSIADRIHAELGRVGPESGVDWGRVAFWWGDERYVAADSDDRNAGAARELFLDGVGVDPRHVHEAPATDSGLSLDTAAAAYGEEVREHGTGSFDVLMLGIGPDGHVASLFPGHPALDVADRVAVAVPDSPKPPPQRISLAFGALNRSRQVWFVASGDSKADAVARALAAEGDLHDTPARGITAAARWYLDQAAAERLPAR